VCPTRASPHAADIRREAVNSLLLLLSCGVSLGLVSGLRLLPGWTGALGPVLCVAGGIVLLVREPEGYDMAGFGLLIGLFAAWASAVAWLLGRGTRVLVASVRRRQPR
jgi:hypothetical protein